MKLLVGVLASAVYFGLMSFVASQSFATHQQVQESKANVIAENMKVLHGQNGIWIDDDMDPAERTKLKTKTAKIDKEFLELTSNMIARERERQADLDTLIFWSNLSGYAMCVLAHAFLIVGFCLGACELRRAYRLRQQGKSEPVEIQLGLEGAALKGSFYGFVVFGIALVFYFAYLQFVYPVTSVS